MDDQADEGAGPEAFDEVAPAAEPDTVPMYAISEVALEEIERFVSGGSKDQRPEARERAEGFIRAARENGPIPPPEPVNQQEDPRINFLTVQIDSLIARLAASFVAAGVLDPRAQQGFALKETLPLQQALAQFAQANQGE